MEKNDLLEKKYFNYTLPNDLIAQSPLLNRDDSRLLVLNKDNGDIIHTTFKSLIDFINPSDCLVFNDTKVMPARLIGYKQTGARVEFLLLKKLPNDRYQVLVKPGKRVKIGDRVIFGDGLLTSIIEDIDISGNRIVTFEYEGIFNEVLDKLGEMPLPHYISQKLDDKQRYQTIYAKEEGSAAAPTAGLHFTPEIFNQLKNKGINTAFVTLHVGIGTFRPVKVENIIEHKMHSEYYNLSQESVDIINNTKKNGGRIIAVGTTSARTLESCVGEDGLVISKCGWTDIFIYPGYVFNVVDALVTNFHLPESTLIMLVSALAGRDNVMNAYNEAIKNKYRFFSFGDAMFIHSSHCL